MDLGGYELGNYGDDFDSESPPGPDEAYSVGPSPFGGNAFADIGQSTAQNVGIGATAAALAGLDPAMALGHAAQAAIGSTVGKGFSPLSDMFASLLGVNTGLGQTASSLGKFALQLASPFVIGPFAAFSPVYSNILGPIFGKVAQELAAFLGYTNFGEPGSGFNDQAGAYADVYASMFGNEPFGYAQTQGYFSDPQPSPFLGEDPFSDIDDPFGGFGDPGDVGGGVDGPEPGGPI